jgi:hypothetical protein
MSHLKSRDEFPVRGEDCNNPEISRKPKTTTTIFFSNKTMNGEVSYRKPNLVAQVAPKLVNCILAFK